MAANEAAEYEAALTKIDHRYMRFAAIYSRYARAVYKLLEPSPTLMERHLAEVVADTKRTWEACREAGIQPDGKHP